MGPASGARKRTAADAGTMAAGGFIHKFFTPPAGLHLLSRTPILASRRAVESVGKGSEGSARRNAPFFAMSTSPQDDATARPGPDPANQPAPSSANFQLSQEPVTAEKPAAATTSGSQSPTAAPAYEHLGELPASYGRQAVYLVAYDPHRLYAYWDLDWNKLPAGSRESLAVRVLHADSGEEESRAEIGRADTGRYLPVQRVGGTYLVELGSGGGTSSTRPWRALAMSDRVTMPPESVAADEENGGETTQFATLPFHVSFQRLTDMLREAMAAGEHLIGAIARLQRAGSGLRGPATANPMTAALASLSGEERRNLATLFGWNPDAHGASSGGLSSGQSSGSGQGGLGGAGAGGFGAGGAGGSEALSSAALLGGVGPSSLSSAALSSAALLRQLAALGAGGSEARELFSAALIAAAGAGASGAGSGGLSSAGAGALSRPGPSSERWRFGAAGAQGSRAPGKDSEAFVRERAERFVRSITSSLDVLGSAFPLGRSRGE